MRKYSWTILKTFPKSILQFHDSKWLNQNWLNDLQEALTKLLDIIDLCFTQLLVFVT